MADIDVGSKVREQRKTRNLVYCLRQRYGIDTVEALDILELMDQRHINSSKALELYGLLNAQSEDFGSPIDIATGDVSPSVKYHAESPEGELYGFQIMSLEKLADWDRRPVGIETNPQGSDEYLSSAGRANLRDMFGHTQSRDWGKKVSA